jgi:hypothetical protein
MEFVDATKLNRKSRETWATRPLPLKRLGRT